MIRFAPLIGFLLLQGCQLPESERKSHFLVEAISKPELGDNVLLRIRNPSQDYLCVPIAEVSLGSQIKAEPPTKYETVVNRPPAELLSGLDVVAGVYVIPPGGEFDAFLDLTELNGRVPAATAITGQVRGADCKDLFTGEDAHIQSETFTTPLKPLAA